MCGWRRIITNLGVGLGVCETKKKKTDLNFYFWSVWLFNHTCDPSLGIGANRDKS